MLEYRIFGPRAKGKFKCSLIPRIFLLFIIYSCTLDALLDSIVGQLSLWKLEQNHRPELVGLTHKAYCVSGSRGSISAVSKQGHGPADCRINYGTTNYCSHDNNTTLDARCRFQTKGWRIISVFEESKQHLIRTIIKIRRWWWWLWWSSFGDDSHGGALWIQAEAIRLVRLEAPNFAEAGQPVRLRCIYETRGDKLQSLSWYKNGHEFYRYQPFERRQPVLAFNYSGVTVDLTKSRNSTVFLTNTTSDTSGRYKCEATATTFQEVNMETYVTILAPSSGAANSNCALINYIAILSIAIMMNSYN